MPQGRSPGGRPERATDPKEARRKTRNDAVRSGWASIIQGGSRSEWGKRDGTDGSSALPAWAKEAAVGVRCRDVMRCKVRATRCSEIYGDWSMPRWELDADEQSQSRKARPAVRHRSMRCFRANAIPLRVRGRRCGYCYGTPVERVLGIPCQRHRLPRAHSARSHIRRWPRTMRHCDFLSHSRHKGIAGAFVSRG